ncbi:CRTAC1 family protein [Limnoglobus roseus]|uniref:CRTAC1 family protein n=1 Tax=Limnoglobus roseus TaxID=2598579 RepID=A0A5C1ADG1_9BACT|nr:CRTAC1 family protein [Limnoglobus roseus]QEL17341.1 CRTAC1 family protein [Limnoglobus roseus]
MFLDCSFVLPAAARATYAGVSVADLDGDGEFEFFVASRGAANRILKYQHGKFFDTAPPVVADARRDTLGAVAGDFDGDGREELYLLNGEPFSDRLFDCQPDGRWADLFDQPRYRQARNAHASQSAAVLDRRGRGRYSFLVASADHPLRLFELSSANTICDLAPALDLHHAQAGSGLVIGPISSDRPDIFCVNEGGPNLLYRNTGVGTFLEVAARHGLRDSAERSRGAMVLDANGDGRLDVCFGNRDGPHRLFVRESNCKFRNVATPAMALPSEVQNVVAADFDNDGFEELLFLNCGESNRLFRRSANPDGYWQLADPGTLDSWGLSSGGAAVADIDGDGRLELLVSNGDSGELPLQLFKWPEVGNAWLRVMPMTRFGAPARGAVVRLIAAGRTQIRAICSGSGYRCQMEPVAHFGLGRCDEVEQIQVTWPDDTTAVIDRPATNRTLVVLYPGS